MSGEVVCERAFNTVIDGEAVPILVQWMKQTPDRSVWRCDYTTAGELYDAEPQVFWWEPDDILGLPLRCGDEKL